MRHFTSITRLFLLLALLGFCSSALADTGWVNSTNLVNNLGEFGVILEDVSLGMGLSLFFSGIFKLKRYGESRTYMSQQMTIARPLMMMISGVMLLILPEIIKTFLFTSFGTSNPVAYSPSNTDAAVLMPPIIMFVKIIGVCSLIRGIVLVSRAGGEQSPPGQISKALLHIVGGILCINIVGTYDLLSNILNLT